MTETRVLRPHRHLLISGILAGLALTTPVFAVAYWLTVHVGTWPIVFGVHLLAVVVALLFVVRYRRTRVVVSPYRVREYGFLGHVSEISNSDIGALHMVELYRDNELDTQPNLFILDRSGTARIRLRGQYWSRSDMEDLAETLDRPIATPAEPITLSELRSSRPEWLYWFERLPVATWL
ncbi:hypothetical protein [Humibacter albus]|uniref:hypothetical protein n=1 Tax=Humibacter albus TaxID=427754 RepID=UPI0005271B9E|nr:hypothetical protein [Humibacter albus]